MFKRYMNRIGQVMSRMSLSTGVSLADVSPVMSRPIDGITGVIFDMDGTITMTGAIDFARMRERCGVPPGIDIIAFCEQHAEPIRSSLFRILEEEEEIGLERMRLRHDAHATLLGLRAKGLNTALVTRNNDAAMHKTIKLLRMPDAFSIMLSRSFTPVKPDPAAVFHICERWGCTPREVVVCGDSLDDMLCGKRAGAQTILIGESTSIQHNKAVEHADYTISALKELLHLL